MKLIVSLMLSSVLTAFGQGPVTITLDKAVDLALEKNIQIIQGQNSVEARQSSVQASVGNLFPSLSASGSYFNRRDWSPATAAGSRFIDGVGNIPTSASDGFSLSESYNAGFSSSITLFNGFANYASVNRTKADASASEYTLNRTQHSVILQTNSLFLNVVSTSQLLKVTDDNLKRSQRQLERITESNKVGSVALADVYRQRVQVGTDELSLIQAQSSHEKAKAD